LLLSVSFLVPSIIIWWTASAHYYPEHSLSRPQTHAEPSCFAENSERRKKVARRRWLLLGRVLLFSTRACCFSFLFWPTRLPYQIANILERERDTTLFCLFVFLFSLFLSLIFSIPGHKPRGLHKHKKQMCFSNYQKKNFFQNFFFLCDCDLDKNVHRMCLYRMQVGFLSLLHVTWFVSFANSQQATVDRYTTAYIMRRTSKYRGSLSYSIIDLKSSRVMDFYRYWVMNSLS